MSENKNALKENKTSLFSIMRWFLGILFAIFLYTFIITSLALISISHTITRKDQMKNLVEQSSIYENFIDSALGMLPQQSSVYDEQNPLALFLAELQNDNSQMRNEVENTFTPLFLQRKTEMVIDAFYDWLEGKTPTPFFELTIFEDDTAIAHIFALTLQDQLQGAQECSESTSPDVMELLSLSCVPADFDINNTDAIAADLLQSENFSGLKNALVLRSRDILIDPQTSLKIQFSYAVLLHLYIILIIFVTVFTFFLMLIIPSWKKGFFVCGIIFILSSLSSLYTSILSLKNSDFLVRLIFQKIYFPEKQLQSFETVFHLFFKSMYSTLLHNIIIESCITLSCGVLFIILGLIIKYKHHAPTS